MSVEKQIVIFASGRGSNAAAIIAYFKETPALNVRVGLIVCNKPGAGVLDIAKNHQIPTLLIDKSSINTPEFIQQINSHTPALIILAGFLWKVPDALVHQYPNQIINIHPALLPKYGGKGMYGHYIHEAVITAHEKESGITIHYVNEKYDEGAIILQARCAITSSDDPISLAQKVGKLEHSFFSKTIEYLLS